MSKQRKNTSSDHRPADRTFWDTDYPKHCNVFPTRVVSLAEDSSKNAGKCQWPLRVSDILASMEPYLNARRELEKQIKTKVLSSSGAGLEWAPSFKTDERWVVEQLQKAELLSEIVSDCFNIKGHRLDYMDASPAIHPYMRRLLCDVSFCPPLLFFAFKERPDLAAAVRPEAIDRVSQIKMKVDLLFMEKNKPPPFGTVSPETAPDLLGIRAILEALGQICDRSEEESAQRKRFNRLWKSGSLDVYRNAGAILMIGREWVGNSAKIEQILSRSRTPSTE